jgi:lysophospholipase L1-like esterase
MMVRPWRTLTFLLGVLSLCALVGALMPVEGIPITDGSTLRFPSIRGTLFPEKEETVDISAIVAMPTEAPETVVAADTVPDDSVTVEPFVFDTTKIPPLSERIALHYPNGDKSVLHDVFAALEAARSGGRPIRVMHYGDSQLEGDRITSYVRNKLQQQFGGNGPGLISVADIVPNFSIDRSTSSNWIRYSVMGRKDPTQHHGRYGALSSFSRFTPILPDSVLPDTAVKTATFTMRRTRNAYAKAQAWTECRMYYGWHRTPVAIELVADGVPVSAEIVPAGNKLSTREWRFASTPEEVTITLSGQDSPDVFGISLEGHNGVNVDNIAARGGAGYEFRRVDQGLLGRMYADLDVKLLILQYGGNVVPNITDAEDVAEYGRSFGAQIARFRKLIPGVAVIVIGPSDMSIKEGEHMVTRPFLEDVRDALKSNALAQGAVFWDMYHAMGGRNSMVSWVEADPPLAATDHTHFSPQGARKIGELFYTAFINDFAEYHKVKE